MQLSLEQIIVGVCGIVVDPFLHLKDVDGEDTGLAVTQAGIQRQQNVADDHAAFRGCVSAVVNGGEGRLSACPGVHGVEVVDKALHSLIGVPVCGFFRPTACPGNDLGSVLSGELEACAQCGGHSTVKGRSIAEAGVFTGGLAGGVDGLLNGFLGIVQIQLVLDCFGEAAAVGAKEGFCNALCHAVIKVRNGLAAVLVILIGLNGDGGQCGVACNALGFTEIAMCRWKSAMEQPDNINLTAGGVRE